MVIPLLLIALAAFNLGIATGYQICKHGDPE